MEETVQSGTVTIARGTGKELARFIAHLRESGQLTPSLLLRSVLGGETAFIAASLADLCDLEPSRTAAIVASGTEPALHALMRRAGIPTFLHPVLVASIRVSATLPASQRRGSYALPVVRAAQAGCLEVAGEEGVRLMALLRRFEAEAARAESRRIAESLRQEVNAEKEQFSLLPADVGPEMLRLGGLTDDAEAASGVDKPAAPEPVLEEKTPMARRIEAVLARNPPIREARPIAAATGEAVPSLKSLIADWKAERAMLDRLESAKIAATIGNRNERAGQSRVA